MMTCFIENVQRTGDVAGRSVELVDPSSAVEELNRLVKVKARKKDG